MTEQQQLPPMPPSGLRRVGWFVIACVVLSLVLTAAARLAGHPVSWTTWALLLLIAVNAAVLFLGVLRRWPRLTRLYILLSLALAVIIIVAESRAIWHQGARGGPGPSGHP